MRFLYELDITFGGDLFFFLPGFYQAFFNIQNQKQHVSPLVKVYVIQQLQWHYRSHMSDF
jgi:hypothetical protein